MKRITDNLKRIESGHFKKVKVGRYELSIQGTEYNYCSPRGVLSSHQYTEMEVAVFYNKKWCNINNSKVFKEFPRYQELTNNYDGMVTAYTDVELINELYEFLLNRKSK